MMRATREWWGYVVFFSLWGYPGTCADGGDFKCFQTMCQGLRAIEGVIPHFYSHSPPWSMQSI